MGVEREREEEKEKEEWKKEGGRVGGRQKKAERESVSAWSTHCLMLCSSATDKGSKSSTESTSAVIHTPLDAEPREKGKKKWDSNVSLRGKALRNQWVCKEEKWENRFHTWIFFPQIYDWIYLWGLQGEPKWNKISEFYLDKLDLHIVHLLVAKSIRDTPQDTLGKQRNRKAKSKRIIPKRPVTRRPRRETSTNVIVQSTQTGTRFFFFFITTYFRIQC